MFGSWTGQCSESLFVSVMVSWQSIGYYCHWFLSHQCFTHFKQLSRKVGAKEYPKWVITISPRQIEMLGWKEGEQLRSEVQNRNLIIQKEDIRKVEFRRQAANKAWKKRKTGGDNQ